MIKQALEEGEASGARGCVRGVAMQPARALQSPGGADGELCGHGVCGLDKWQVGSTGARPKGGSVNSTQGSAEPLDAFGAGWNCVVLVDAAGAGVGYYISTR